MRILIRRKIIDGKVWFEILNINLFKNVYFNFGYIRKISEIHNVVDMDAIDLERMRISKLN